MSNQNGQQDRSRQEPKVTRYVHPICTTPPCAGDMSWIRGTLACHSQMLTEILERLRGQEGGS